MDELEDSRGFTSCLLIYSRISKIYLKNHRQCWCTAFVQRYWCACINRSVGRSVSQSVIQAVGPSVGHSKQVPQIKQTGMTLLGM